MCSVAPILFARVTFFATPYGATRFQVLGKCTRNLLRSFLLYSDALFLQGPVQFKDDLGHGALVAFFYEVAFLPLRKTLDDELILLDVAPNVSQTG